MARGLLIVLEGAEGAGKTTQLRRLAQRFTEADVAHITVREPGGTPLGEGIRGLLLDGAVHPAPRAETLLFIASRAQLVTDVIGPALADGRAVIMDRFFLSTYAYQIAGRGLPENDVRAANRLAIAGLVPDLTLLLELSAAEGLARADNRGARDRMEQSGEDFHQRVSQAFAKFADASWQTSHAECGPIVRIDALGAEDEVAERIAAAIAGRWPETFGSIVRSSR